MLDFGAPAAVIQDAAPKWFGSAVRATGRVWESVGVAMPLLVPSAAVVVEFRAV